MDFAQRVRTYRKAKNMTQQELADLLGVSNKTVSRWEVEGSWPDPPMLLQLARALGVSVDDLLDDRKPLRTLTTADWQGLLSFAFAVGGGILFFLLRLFTPTPVCYGVYLAAMLYGCYLQRYYTYRSRWFFWSNLGMDLAVNLSAGGWLANSALALVVYSKMGVRSAENPEILLGMLGMGNRALLWAPIAGAAAGAALTAVTQYLLRRWMRGESGPWNGGVTLERRRPSRWSVLPIVLAFALPCYFLLFKRNDLPIWLYENQSLFFRRAWAGAAVLSLLPFLGKRRRGQLIPALLMALILWGVGTIGVLGPPPAHFNPYMKKVVVDVSPRWQERSIWFFNWKQLAVSTAAAAVFLLTSIFRPRLKRRSGPEKPAEEEANA